MIIAIISLSLLIMILTIWIIWANIKWQKDIEEKETLKKQITILQQLNQTEKDLKEKRDKIIKELDKLEKSVNIQLDNSSSLAAEIVEHNKTIKDLTAQIQQKTDELKKVDEAHRAHSIGLEQLKLLLEDWSNTKNIAEKERTAPLLCEEKTRIMLNESELAQIKILKDIMPLLSGILSRNLAKALWETLYRPKLAALEAAWQVTSRVSGIYKITVFGGNDFVHVDSCATGAVAAQPLPAPQVSTPQGIGRIYIGQSVDIGKRWYDHAKRALGVDDPTRGKLYPAMSAAGLENCTWEVIEECAENMLNEKEKYWIKYYASDQYGLNSTKGGS